MEQHFGSCLGCIVDTGMFQAVGKSYPGWMLDMMLIPSRKKRVYISHQMGNSRKINVKSNLPADAGDMFFPRWNCRSSQRWQPMVVGSEDHQKSTGRLSNRKIMGKSWELPTSKRVTSDTFVFLWWCCGWLKAAGHCIHYQQATWLGVSTWFSCFKVLGQKACVCFFLFDAYNSPIVQYRVIYGYRTCLLQYTHVSFPPKTTQSWWSCGLTKRKPLSLKRLYLLKTEDVNAVRKGKRALYYDMDLHCCWLGKSLGSLCWEMWGDGFWKLFLFATLQVKRK